MTNAILITGCTHGLGYTLALNFAYQGLKTYAVGRKNNLMSQLSALSNNIIPIIADVATEKGRSKIFDSVNHDELTYIIHNAAIATPSLITTLTESNLREHFETNFFAPILLNQKFISTLKRNSRIMHISSNAADLALSGLMQYCVSKNALEKSTQCFNNELNSKEIYFANLRPGMIDTDMQKKLRESSETDLPGKNYYLQAKTDNTLAQPEVVSKFVTWVMLNTDNSEFSQTLWNINDSKYHSKWLEGKENNDIDKNKTPTYYDLTASLTDLTAVFPGDPQFKNENISSLAKGSKYNLNRIHLGNHTGTHIDFPAHVIKGGKSSTDFNIDSLIGAGLIIEVPDECKSITKEFIKTQKILKNDFVFFKTSNSKIPKHTNFISKYVYIEPDAAEELIKKGVKVVGIDYISIDRYEAEELPVHTSLLSKDILIVEGLELNNVPLGRCKIYILPIHIKEMDGLPARVIAKM